MECRYVYMKFAPTEGWFKKNEIDIELFMFFSSFCGLLSDYCHISNIGIKLSQPPVIYSLPKLYGCTISGNKQ